MKHFYPLVLYFTILLNLTGLQAQQVVIAPAGDSDSNNNIVLDWTMGELLVQTIESSTGLLTEGFHQPIIIVETALSGVEENNTLFSVYPNPAQSSINIEINSDTNDEAILYLHSSTGNLLKSKCIESNAATIEWDLTEYAAGLYLITLKDEKGILIKSCKVSKLNF